MDAEEREWSCIIDELADLDTPAPFSHALDLVDAMKFEYKSGNEHALWLYRNKLVALGRVVYAKVRPIDGAAERVGALSPSGQRSAFSRLSESAGNLAMG